MSSFLEEIVKSSSSYDCKTDPGTNQHDKLEMRIRNEMNAADVLNSEDSAKTLNTNIESWMVFLRKNLLEEFESMKVIFKKLSQNIIMNEIKRFENEMSELKNSNIEYQNEINSLKNELSNHKSNIKSLSIKLLKNKNKHIEAKYMFNWRLRKEQIDRQHFCEKISAKFYQTNLIRKTFYGWKQGLEMTWKNRNNNKIERQAQSVCQQLISEYEKQIIELRSEISKLQEENVAMQTNRSATQDAVKKALMRGVCALNMETMSILNQNGILSEKECENNNNNNCLQNVSFTNGQKKYVPFLENIMCEDQRGLPINKYSRNIPGYNDNMNYFPSSSSNYKEGIFNGNNAEPKKISNDNPNPYHKADKTQYPLQISNQVSSSYHKMKSHFANETCVPKPSLSKNSTITIQAGNPTGSHTHTSNPSLNITVQRHTNNETGVSSHGGVNYQTGLKSKN